MKYLLDTDIASYYLRGRYSLDQVFESKGFSNIRLSIVTVAELEVVAYKNPSTKINLSNINKFTRIGVIELNRETWQIYSKTKAALEKIGKPKGDIDMLQASIAKQYGLIVVTNNTKHFEEIVDIENWIR